MNVLVLGKSPSPISPIIIESGCRGLEYADALEIAYLREHSIRFAVSYGYRHIIHHKLIEYLNGKVINLHISLLPWNRGADPNQWSFLENTPKGVTIHYIDEGLDTGDIIAQRVLTFEDEYETLATTYQKLNDAIIELFKAYWPSIKNGTNKQRKQAKGGTFHKLSDKAKYAHLLEESGWDTPVRYLVGKAIHRKTR